MSDLISREALYEQIALMRKDLGQRVLRVRLGSEKQIKYSNQLDVIDEIKSMVKDEPTVDAKEVVCCKNCKYFCSNYPNVLNADGLCENTDTLTDKEDFCSHGASMTE
jgi:hypothetical protein